MSLVIKNHFQNITEEHKNQFLQLYKNPFSSFEYITSFFKNEQLNVITIHDKDTLLHIIVFFKNITTQEIFVLNRLYSFSESYFQLLCSKLMLDYPDAKKIIFKHLYNSINERLSNNWVCKPHDENYIISLPQTFDDYLKKLSSNMRQQSRRRVANLKRAFSNYKFLVYEKENVLPNVIRRIIQMNHLRMTNKNIVPGIDETYTNNILSFIPKYGFISVIEIDNLIVAGLIMYRVNDNYYMQTISSDPDFDKYSVGHVCLFLTLQKCIELKGNQFHLLWGNNNYKKRFLGIRNQLFNVVYFRNSLYKLEYIFKNNSSTKKVLRYFNS